MSDAEEEKPFAVERAKTGRAKCKKCKCPIDKGTVRIAKLASNPFGEGKMKCWHHVVCLFDVFAKQRASTKKIDDPEEDISGWDRLEDDGKKIVLDKLKDFQRSVPPSKQPKKSPKATKAVEATQPKTPKNDPQLPTPSRCRPAATGKLLFSADTDDRPMASTSKDNGEESTTTAVPDEIASSPEAGKAPAKDETFRVFRRICADLANASAYTEKTAILKRLFDRGSDGEGFKSDVLLWCRMLLPGAVKRIYNLQSKQLIKLFARLLCQDEDEMLEDLEQGDIAETIRVFFEGSPVLKPSARSAFTIREVDQLLDKLSHLTREDDQIKHFKSIVSNCTGNDLKMIIRLIKHDLRINAGPKHILEAVHEDAYRAFQVSQDLPSVISRCLRSNSEDSSKASLQKSPGGSRIALSLMTPVLPMLAEACKSVDMAMKRCPHGMLAEVKYDGERVQMHKRGGEFRYFSRSLKPVLPHKVNHFKEYIPQAFPGGDDLILDAEILMIDTNTGQPLPFGSLGVHKRTEFKDANVCLFVFDCIYYNGEILMDKSMKERRSILKTKMREIPNRIMFSEVHEINDPRGLSEMIAKVLKMGLEGLVLKDVTGKYEPGKRHWLKVKKDYLFGGAMADSADLVVLGAWYGTGNKGGMMSVFLMGCYDADRDCWLTVTKVHTGHDDATLERLQDELGPKMVKIAKDPNLVPRWMRANKPMVPDFVAKDPKDQPVWEITGAEFTNQGVHTADAISIRFPRVTRIRDDKDWKTATNLNELRKLFKNSAESMDLSLLLGSGAAGPSTSAKPGTLDKFLVKSPSSKNNDGKRKKSKLKQHGASSSEDEEEGEDGDEVLEPSTAEVKVKVEPLEQMKKKKKRAKMEEVCPTGVKIEPKTEAATGIKIEPKTETRTMVEDRSKKIKSEYNESLDESRAEFYAFINDDYIEFSSSGSPLNWIEGRKPAKGLPADAKPISATRRRDTELSTKSVLKNVRASLTGDFKGRKRESMWRTLKTLGATVLREEDRSRATHVIHSSKDLPVTVIRDYADVPKEARHVHESWVDVSAAESRIQDPGRYAVELAGVYCSCPCPARQ